MDDRILVSCTNEYFIDKLFKSYIYASDLNNVLNYSNEESVIFKEDNLLVYLEKLAEENLEFEYLDNFCKNNIFWLLHLLRNSEVYKNRNNYNELIDRINNIILMLNRSGDINVFDFYFDEIKSRFYFSKKFIEKIEKGTIELVPEEIRAMISNDVLMLLNLNADQKEFDSVFEDLVENEYVLYSIRRMLDENPDMFKDEIIYKRVYDILKYNLNVLFIPPSDYQWYKSNYKIYKKLVKNKRDK